jgi:hypothetical protein
LDADVSASTIRAGLGEPYFIQKDGPDETWFYEFGSVEWQLEWFKGRFQDFLAQTEPELADEAARREYGVDKPWPF